MPRSTSAGGKATDSLVEVLESGMHWLIIYEFTVMRSRSRKACSLKFIEARAIAKTAAARGSREYCAGEG